MSDLRAGDIVQIVSEETLNHYVQDIISRGGTPTVTQGTSMQPLIQPNELIYTEPIPFKYLIIGSIYSFKEGNKTIIKRLVKIEENVVQHGMRGTNYIFEGDNRETSIDKKVFVSNTDSIKNVFEKVVLHPKLPISEKLITQLRGGNCMSNENVMKQPVLSADALRLIQENDELNTFIQDIRAVTHNTALRCYEMSCIIDGMLNFLRSKELTNTDEMFNFINISTNMKEWTVATGEYMSFDEFFKRFYPNLTLADLKTAKHKINIQQIIEEHLQSKLN